MGAGYHRHDISDKVWSLPEPHLPGQHGRRGGIAQDNRRFINAVFWVLRTGAPWRDLPPDYGKRGSVHQRFIRWRRKGVWEKVLEILIDEADYEWLMIDASHIKGFDFPLAHRVLEELGADFFVVPQPAHDRTEAGLKRDAFAAGDTAEGIGIGLHGVLERKEHLNDLSCLH